MNPPKKKQPQNGDFSRPDADKRHNAEDQSEKLAEGIVELDFADTPTKPKSSRIPRRRVEDRESKDTFVKADGFVDDEDANLSSRHLCHPNPKKWTTRYRRTGQLIAPEAQIFTRENTEPADPIPGMDCRNQDPADLASGTEEAAAATV